MKKFALMSKRLLDNVIYVHKFEHEQSIALQAQRHLITIASNSCSAGGCLALFKHLCHDLNI